jgi:hypothetical protein
MEAAFTKLRTVIAVVAMLLVGDDDAGGRPGLGRAGPDAGRTVPA